MLFRVHVVVVAVVMVEVAVVRVFLKNMVLAFLYVLPLLVAVAVVAGGVHYDDHQEL